MDDDDGRSPDTDLASQRELIRYEESVRREFVDDLLRGDADVARLVQRAQPFGLDLSRPHHVVLAEPPATSPLDLGRAAGRIERAVVDRYGDREVLVATKDGILVVILPGVQTDRPPTDQLSMSAFVHNELLRHTSAGDWRVAAGRPTWVRTGSPAPTRRHGRPSGWLTDSGSPSRCIPATCCSTG